MVQSIQPHSQVVMKTRTSTSSFTEKKTPHLKGLNETEPTASTAKRQKVVNSKTSAFGENILQPLMNISTAEYMATFMSEERVNTPSTLEKSIKTVSTRFSKKYQQTIVRDQCNELESTDRATVNDISLGNPNNPKDKRISGRSASGTKKCNVSEQYRIDDTSMGFSWWSNVKREKSLTQSEYSRSSLMLKKGFNGDITLTPLCGPHIAYAFVVPFYTQIGMMTAFKTMPNQLLVRERMKELSSMKTCYYTQLHWKRGTGNASHTNESDWQDNPLLDPTASLLLDAYMTSLSTAISSSTQWNVKYKTLCGLIETGKAGHQSPHVDDKGCVEKEEHLRPFILHHPLCEEGSSLQIWLPNNKGTHSPTLLHVPFGTALLLRGDVYHAGCYGTTGNLRFHACFTPLQGSAEGRELGIMNIDSNERLRETDLPAAEVNHILLQKNKLQCKFTDKYLKRMKQYLPVSTFWGQNPQGNVSGKPKRTEYS